MRNLVEEDYSHDYDDYDDYDEDEGGALAGQIAMSHLLTSIHRRGSSNDRGRNQYMAPAADCNSERG